MAFVGFAGLLLAAGRVDAVAAAAAVLALVATGVVVRYRRRRVARRAAIVLGCCVSIAGLVAAISLPVLRQRTTPLLVDVRAQGSGPTGASSLYEGHATPGKTVLGFAESDIDNNGAGVDQYSAKLSVLAATGLTLGSTPGTVEVAPINDSLVRAHLNGAAGYAVLTNYDGSTFSPELAATVLDDAASSSRLVNALTKLVAKDGWDGIVIDFEQLVPGQRDSFTRLVSDLSSALAGRKLVVAVPAFLDATDPAVQAFDLAALGRSADSIVWMAYDQHDPSEAAGPIAGLPWVRGTLDVVAKLVDPAKILLGLAGYGYAWPGITPLTTNRLCATDYGAATDQPTPADECTIPEAARLAGEPGASIGWDPVQAELHGVTADGRELWFEDAYANRLRAALVNEYGLGGVALWRVGSQDPHTLTSLPFTTAKDEPISPDRPVEHISSNGVVALTFDDGPDPTWTPRVLAVLRQEQVPATFFVIGSNAEDHPGLLQAEVAAGHVIGNHTYSHEDTATNPVWRSRLDMLAGQVVIEGITNLKPRLFRAPYGSGDSHTGHKGADALAVELGMVPVNWNDDPLDWSNPGVDEIVSRVMAQATERTVVLLHDGGGDRSQTLAALPKLIEALRAKGYVFTTVDALDASVQSPYVMRDGFGSKARGVAIVATFRLQAAGRKLLFWLVVLTAVLSLVRVLGAGPLAIRQWWRTRKPPLAFSGPLPSVSVVIPAYNEANVIAKTIAAIARCDPPPLEVIIIDDGSTDETFATAQAAVDNLGLDALVKIHRQPNAGKAAALNRGFAEATGEVVMVVDADTVVDPGIIGAFAPHFVDPRVGAVAGNVKVGNRKRLLPGMQALEYIVAINLDRRAQDVAGVMAVVPGAAGAFRRTVAIECGGYPSDTLVEDADFTAVLLRAGWRIPYESRAVAWTEAPETIADVVRQRRRWSYGTIQVVAKHRHAILEPAAGRFGVLGLPWMLTTQVILPVLGPVADAFLILQLLNGQFGLVVGMLLISLVGEMVMAAIAIRADRERWRLLLLGPPLRLVWRPLLLWVSLRSARRFVRGDGELWRQVRRYDTVALPTEPQPV